MDCSLTGECPHPGRERGRWSGLTLPERGLSGGKHQCIVYAMDPQDQQTRFIRLKDGSTKEIQVKPKVDKKAKEREALLSSDGRTQQANIRRSKVIELVGEGLTPEKACREVDISTKTYYAWRRDYPGFKTQVDLARQKWQESQGSLKWDTFLGFRKRFFGFDTYQPQMRIADAIESAADMEVVLVLVPPEFGKTTLVEDKICEILAKDPDHRIAYISEGSGHSRKVGSRIRRRMTDTVEFGDYIARFGPFYVDGQEKEGKVWTAERFTVNHAGHDERDYSFEARGARSNIQGSRVDTLVLDDIQSLKSLSQTGFLITQLRQEWLTRLGKKGRCIIIGNRVGVGDFYEEAIDKELIDRLIEIPAVDEEGHSTCPELWPDDLLAKRRKQVGEDVWARTYMQNPIAAGTVTFTEDVIEAAKDKNRTIKKVDGIDTVMSLDPGLGGGNSLTVCQFTSSGLLAVDQVTDYGFGRTEEILERVAAFASMYKPSYFIIEMMAFQQALGKDDRMLALAEKHGFRIYPHVTSDNKFDPSYGVASMATAMHMKELTFPWANERAQDTFQPLFDEMRIWRPFVRGVKLRQDRVMSLWFIYLWWQNHRHAMEFEAKKDTFKRRGLPYGRPTHLRRVV